MILHKYYAEYDLKDHLGNTRVTFMGKMIGGSSVAVMQTSNYYPFGLTMTQTNNYPATDYSKNKYLYNGKELQDDRLNGTFFGMLDYGARFYDPQIGRWHSVDPASEVSRRWNPYSYCYDNPIRFIDPDGMVVDDYFNEAGKYLGSDEAKTDNVRVIDQEDWDANKEVNADKKETINHEAGNSLSANASEANLTTDASLNIYEHYNPTDLPLKANDNDPGVGGMAFHAIKYSNNTTTEDIIVNVEGDKATKISNHANEIINNFSHEEKHYNDYKAAGFDAYKSRPLDQREQRAVYTQMQHSSWSGTRLSFQRGAKVYGALFGTLYRLKPISGFVTQ